MALSEFRHFDRWDLCEMLQPGSSALCWTEVEKSRSTSGMKHQMYDNSLLAIPSVSEGSIPLAGK